jgi:hypothetical protein
MVKVGVKIKADKYLEMEGVLVNNPARYCGISKYLMFM